MTAQHTSHPDDALVIAGKAYSSRLLTGTGKFKDLDETRRATEAAGTCPEISGRWPRNGC